MRRLLPLRWSFSLALIVATVTLSAQAVDPPTTTTLNVTLTGIAGKELDNVRAHIDIWQQRSRTDLKEAHIKKLHRLATAQIETALQPFGYYRPKIDAQLDGADTQWRANYAIDPGKPVPVATVDIQLTGAGAQDLKLSSLARQTEIRVGDPLDHQKYEALKARLLAKALALGYLNAGYQLNQMTVDLDQYQAVVALHLDTGNLYRVGDVRFEQTGATRLGDKLLRRFITFAPGDPLTNELTLSLQTALTNSGFFKTVEIVPQKNQVENQRLPLLVKLGTVSRSKYRFGAGFGTDTGPRGSVAHDRLVNKRGHKLSVTALAAQKDRSAEVSYTIPLQNPIDDSLVFSSGVSELDTDSWESRELHGGIAHTQLRCGWRETLGITAEYEDYKIADIRSTSILLFPGASWMRTISDHPLFPSHGWRLSLNLLGSAKSLGSDATFGQARIDGKWLTTYATRNRLIARGALGATMTSSFTQLPPSKRFFAGGDNSVRGYDFEALGATDSSGNVIGGRYLIAGSLEYERLLTDNWGAAVFYDAGNAFNSLDESLNKAIGIGARWRTPIGLVRVDIARPLNDADSAYRLHLVIGPAL